MANIKEDILERLRDLSSDALSIRDDVAEDNDAWGLIDDIRNFIDDVTEQIDDECDEIESSEEE